MDADISVSESLLISSAIFICSSITINLSLIEFNVSLLDLDSIFCQIPNAKKLKHIKNLQIDRLMSFVLDMPAMIYLVSLFDSCINY